MIGPRSEWDDLCALCGENIPLENGFSPFPYNKKFVGARGDVPSKKFPSLLHVQNL
jgi:hypothetical protein